jgi:hypothetical protein
MVEVEDRMGIEELIPPQLLAGDETAISTLARWGCASPDCVPVTTSR